MYQAFALIRNLTSPSDSLALGEYALVKVDVRNLEGFRALFKSDDIMQDDWIYKRTYDRLPTGPPTAVAGLGAIPQDTEDALFLLRLFKVGDISFSKHVIVRPDGRTFRQYPYRMINDMNAQSAIETNLTTDECESVVEFSNGLRASECWKAPWFQVARRFFMYGGGKEYLPQWDDCDRVVDYATAIEATLVPEQDFLTDRTANRVARIVTDDATIQSGIVTLFKTFYGIRSTMVHGDPLDKGQQDWLIENALAIELRVRQTVVNGVQKIPADEKGRKVFLAALYDVADTKRGEETLRHFAKIQTDDIKRDTLKRISDRMQRKPADRNSLIGRIRRTCRKYMWLIFKRRVRR